MTSLLDQPLFGVPALALHARIENDRRLHGDRPHGGSGALRLALAPVGIERFVGGSWLNPNSFRGGAADEQQDDQITHVASLVGEPSRVSLFFCPHKGFPNASELFGRCG